MELGLHIADFTWTGGAAELGPRLARHAKSAEDAGITRITVMDHFWQIQGVGPEEHEMLEAYTALGFIAAHTTAVKLHTLVTGVIYREPGLLAKAVTTLDVLSGGRAGLGIGAAWNGDESAGLGFDFPPVAERFTRLEEAIQVCLQMWSGSQAPYAGKHYQLGRTLNSPQSLSRPRPYLMIGGSGEKKTLRLVAQYADACNLFGSPDAPRKLEVLKAHCDEAGRDYEQIEKTTMLAIDPSTTKDDFIREAAAMREAGFAAAYVFARDITEPEKIIELLGSAVPASASQGRPAAPAPASPPPSRLLAAGRVPGPESSIGKVHAAELNQRAQSAAADLLGAAGVAWEGDAGDPSDYARSMPAEVRGMLRSRANTLEGGTSEVNRNVLAERMLGLAKEPDPWRGKPWRELPRS